MSPYHSARESQISEVESRTQSSRPRTRKNFETKDRPFRGQGQRPRTQTQVFSKKKVFKKFFSGDLYLRKPKKRSSQIFCKVSGVFRRNFTGYKIVLSSSREQGNFQGLEASRPRSRTSKCVLEDVLEAKDVIEDSTSVKYTITLIRSTLFTVKLPYKFVDRCHFGLNRYR